MILALRRRHRRMFAVIGVLLPIAFVVGIAARQAVPRVAALPDGLADSSRQFTSTEWERDDVFTQISIPVRLLRERANDGQFAVLFAAPKDFSKPDLIVYWVTGNASIGRVVPEDARLLGAFNSSSLALPGEVMDGEGSLILFSLADQEIVAVSKPIRLAPSKK